MYCTSHILISDLQQVCFFFFLNNQSNIFCSDITASALNLYGEHYKQPLRRAIRAPV